MSSIRPDAWAPLHDLDRLLVKSFDPPRAAGLVQLTPSSDNMDIAWFQIPAPHHRISALVRRTETILPMADALLPPTPWVVKDLTRRLHDSTDPPARLRSLPPTLTHQPSAVADFLNSLQAWRDLPVAPLPADADVDAISLTLREERKGLVDIVDKLLHYLVAPASAAQVVYPHGMVYILASACILDLANERLRQWNDKNPLAAPWLARAYAEADACVAAGGQPSRLYGPVRLTYVGHTSTYDPDDLLRRHETGDSLLSVVMQSDVLFATKSSKARGQWFLTFLPVVPDPTLGDNERFGLAASTTSTFVAFLRSDSLCPGGLTARTEY